MRADWVRCDRTMRPGCVPRWSLRTGDRCPLGTSASSDRRSRCSASTSPASTASSMTISRSSPDARRSSTTSSPEATATKRLTSRPQSARSSPRSSGPQPQPMDKCPTETYLTQTDQSAGSAAASAVTLKVSSAVILDRYIDACRLIYFKRSFYSISSKGNQAFIKSIRFHA